ncbi:MAG: hypothetical protein WA951_12570 [Leeuwenhoekiella sp.]
MKNIILITLFLIVLSGCNNDDQNFDENSSTDVVNLRITNSSKYFYNSIVVNPGGRTANFESLKSGGSTEYQVFETAYSYGYVKIKIEDSVYLIQPYDYFGEIPLENGYYSYKIDIKPNDATGRLELINTFIKD